MILVYGNAGELHETAIKFTSAVPAATVVSGTGTIKTKILAGNSLVLQYKTTGQTVVQVGNTLLYILGMLFALEWISLLNIALFSRSGKRIPVLGAASPIHGCLCTV